MAGGGREGGGSGRVCYFDSHEVVCLLARKITPFLSTLNDPAKEVGLAVALPVSTSAGVAMESLELVNTSANDAQHGNKSTVARL